jgi:large subunit ribosomal protein L31
MEYCVMKAEIHPTYYTEAKVSCVCGNTFLTGSVMKEINVDICSACHPFFSGKQKLVDTEGRVEKFKKKYASFYDKKK